MGLPQRMRAVSITAAGAPEVLRLIDTELPQPAAGEVLVRVATAGVNRPDVLQRRGLYPVPPDASPLPGLEVAGTVVAAAADVTEPRVGATVMALSHGGGYAEYCAVPAGHCLPVPSSLGLVEAAAIPETFFTVEYNLFMRAGLADGESLLVHGGSSGIGATAIQLAAAAGARIATTAGSEEKCAFCRKLGANLAINYRTRDWASELHAWSGTGIDVVLDMVAGRYLQKNLDLLAPDGRYSLIGFMDGATAQVDVTGILTRQLTLTGSALRPRSVEEKTAIAGAVAKRALPLLAAGTVKPVVYETFPLADAARAHALMETSEHMGKIVLVVEPSAAE